MLASSCLLDAVHVDVKANSARWLELGNTGKTDATKLKTCHKLSCKPWSILQLLQSNVSKAAALLLLAALQSTQLVQATNLEDDRMLFETPPPSKTQLSINLHAGQQ